ncbi:MAG: LexA repressor [Chlamydiae bacterium]|nr:LexA repressor [Chlamydiota bacterium]
MIGLTKRQQEIVEFIEDFVATHRFSPSFREIGDHFGFSSLGSVYNHIRSLKKKGALVSEKRTPRSLLPERYQEQSRAAPLIGTISGSRPIETLEKVEMIPLPPEFISEDGESYLLKVGGDELIEEGMLDGDLLIVRPHVDFEPGEMVIALIEGGTALIKRIFPEPPFYRFESVKTEVQPFRLREDHVEIQGIVTALLRHYSS